MFLNKILRVNCTQNQISSDANLLASFFLKSRNFILRRDQSSYSNLITKDVAKVFFNPDAQKLMKKLTEFELEKIFRTRAMGSVKKRTINAFMTNAELQRAQAYAIKKGYEKLQMPPIVPACSTEVEVLDNTPAIVGFCKWKHVFTDISYGISDRKRLIVVREPSGVLRKALPPERHRMNEIYFSRTGRTLQHPRMFEKENLENVWQRGEFEFILDRACCQFEPDDPKFHEIVFSTYEKVNEVRAFQNLRSTRHFGPFAFYLCLTKNLDNLIEENLNTERLREAVLAVKLYSMLNPDCEFNKLNVSSEDEANYLRAFLQSESKNKNKLIDLLDTYAVEAIPSHSKAS